MSAFPSALPAARTPDPMDAPPLRWGVIGPGWIAERFIGSLQRHTRQQVLAVGSRDLGRSTAFAAKHGIDRAYGSYQELLADPDVDVVYIATPHNAHYPCALLSLQAGKHTLVEKPIALNAGQATELAETGRRAGRLLHAEALWTMFLPKFDVIRQLLESGALGEIRTVIADHGEYFTDDHRIMRHDLAGGPLLDLGTYPISFAAWVLGEPATVLAAGQPHPAGVNGQVSRDPGRRRRQPGRAATPRSSAPPRPPAVIAGTAATLTIPGPYYQPGDMTLTSADRRGADLHRAGRSRTTGCISRPPRWPAASPPELLESPLRPLADSIATMRVVDEIRRQLGIVFDEERRSDLTTATNEVQPAMR